MIFQWNILFILQTLSILELNNLREHSLRLLEAYRLQHEEYELESERARIEEELILLLEEEIETLSYQLVRLIEEITYLHNRNRN
jgi:hypothetical protein